MNNLIFSNIVLISCISFLAICAFIVYRNLQDNPYTGSEFFINSTKGEDSALYISTVELVDGKGNQIPKFRRVSCPPGSTYLKSESDWFYNCLNGHGSEELIKFVPITEEQATGIYKRHRSYTQEVKAKYG